MNSLSEFSTRRVAAGLLAGFFAACGPGGPGDDQDVLVDAPDLDDLDPGEVVPSDCGASDTCGDEEDLLELPEVDELDDGQETPDPCEPNPCSNGGVCSSDADGEFVCDCSEGWAGTRCEVRVTGCSANPCANGTCTDLSSGGFECACDVGWSGDLCDVADPCAPEPCVNGTCTAGGDEGFVCSCEAGWMGARCDVPADICVASLDCDGVAETAGLICVDGACVPCVTSRNCTNDPAYGLITECIEGRCVECTGVGCRCATEDECDAELVCDSTRGTCQMDGCAIPGIGCPCDDDAACGDGGLVCLDGMCQEPCFGTDGCACSMNSDCAVGLRCVTGRCEDCTVGAEAGCSCDVGAACLAPTLRCDDVNRCEICPEGTAGCGCVSGAVPCSDAGYVCIEGVCVVDACPAGGEGCACRGGPPACDGELTCQAGVCVTPFCVANPGGAGCPCPCGDGLECIAVAGECSACSPRTVGCSCADDDCATGFVCDGPSELCRSPRTCAEVGCAPRQDCREAEIGADALCLPSCEPGFAWNATTSRCDAVVANCRDDGTPGSIRAECAEDGYSCLEVGGTASCGLPCEPGWIEDPVTAQCRDPLTCEDRTCDVENRVCVPAVTGAGAADAYCDTCVDGFFDDAGTCVRYTCAAEPAANSIAAACEAQNKLCESAPAPEGARCDRCVDDYADVGGVCTAIATCASLNCEEQRRSCVEAVGATPAYCGGCAAPYYLLEGTCVAESCTAGQGTDLTAACSAENRMCVVDGADDGARCGDCMLGFALEGGICVAECSCLARIEGTGPTACDPCGGATTCEDDPSGGSFCRACGPREAYSAEIGCVDCDAVCRESVGFTGAVHPFTTDSNACVCVTRSGYYTRGETSVEACDSDGDGWISSAAVRYWTSDLAGGEGDEALSGNWRCGDSEISYVALQNELGERLVLRVPGTSLPMVEPTHLDNQTTFNTTPAVNFFFGERRLRTSEVNPFTKYCGAASGDYNANGIADVDEHANRAGVVADYAGFLPFSYFAPLHEGWLERGDAIDPDIAAYKVWVVAEVPRCSERFPLLYADDGLSGLLSGNPLDAYWRHCGRTRRSTYDESRALGRNTYDFGEYNCSPASGRCNTRSPYVFDGRDADAYADGLVDEEWPTGIADPGLPEHRACYDTGVPTDRTACDYSCGNVDVGGALTWTCQWVCERNYECRRIDIDPTYPADPGPLSPAAESFLCSWFPDDGAETATLDDWWGMNHASQFQCSKVVEDASVVNQTNTPHERELDQFYFPETGQTASAPFEMNTCRVSNGASLIPGGVGEESGRQGRVPDYVCETQPTPPAIAPGYLRWSVARYSEQIAGTPAEDRACLDEAREWPQLCGGYPAEADGANTAVSFDGLSTDYGRLVCGCSLNAGGPGCSVGCGRAMVSVGYQPTAPPTADFPGGRRGTWLCGEYTQSTNPLLESTDGRVMLRGRVEPNPTSRTPMCSAAGCNTGTVLR